MMAHVIRTATAAVQEGLGQVQLGSARLTEFLQAKRKRLG